jgi:zinc D-Ala-D-Ala dipeptidase
MKPYHQIPIVECGEPLVPIPLEQFAVVSPHPYIQAGANYNGRSPYFLRQSILDALIQAQGFLRQFRPGWHIQIFDAYRPVEVQQQMVDYTFTQILQTRHWNLSDLSLEQQEEIWQQVYQIWAVPSFDPATPPPHSTGAAVDLTLVDAAGKTVDMGSEIDELSARSHPDYYVNSDLPEAHHYRTHRQLLNAIMLEAGFCRHPGEWWHFSCGDQMWAWLMQGTGARYGRWEMGVLRTNC